MFAGWRSRKTKAKMENRKQLNISPIKYVELRFADYLGKVINFFTQVNAALRPQSLV
jgi:hypothetical protein